MRCDVGVLRPLSPTGCSFHAHVSWVVRAMRTAPMPPHARTHTAVQCMAASAIEVKNKEQRVPQTMTLGQFKLLIQRYFKARAQPHGLASRAA